MQGLNVIGSGGTTGIGNAFAMHADVLASLCPVAKYDLGGEGVLEYERTYFQSLPRLVEKAVKDFGLAPGRNIGYFEWESTELNESFRKAAHYFSEFWTSSRYAQVALESLGKPVKLVPHYVKTLKYRQPNEKKVVLMAFDGHSKLLRKNPVAGVRAFRKAFERRKDVELVVKGRNVGRSIWQWLAWEATGANVRFVTDELSKEAMDALYSECNVLLSPHRSEGFGLHLLEAMAHGKTCVATSYGGCVDFMTEKNSYLVAWKEVDVTDDYYKGKWAEPDMDSLVSCLRQAVSGPEAKHVAAFDTAVEWNFTKCVRDTQKALG